MQASALNGSLNEAEMMSSRCLLRMPVKERVFNLCKRNIIAAIGAFLLFVVGLIACAPASAQISNGDFANVIAFEAQSGSNLSGPGRSGFSSAGQRNYFADEWFSGDQIQGTWQPFFQGAGSVDTLQPGGVTNFADGLPDLPADGNDRFLGMIRSGPTLFNSRDYVAEYATTQVIISTPGTYRLSYWWANAGVFNPNGTSTFTTDAQVEFFVDSDNDYGNDGRYVTELSTIQPFEGFGNQQWRQVEHEFFLAAGTHWFGFTTTQDLNYVAIDSVSLQQVPCTFESDNVLCDLDETGQPTGDFVVTGLFTNLQDIPGTHLLLPPNATTPEGVEVCFGSGQQVLVFDQPVNNGESFEVGADLSNSDAIVIKNAMPGDELCFRLVLLGDNGVECCTVEVCFEMPPCDCLQVDRRLDRIVSNADGTIDYTFQLTNLFGQDVYHAFLAPNGTETLSPDYFDLVAENSNAPLGQGQSVMLTTTISGAQPEELVSFLITLHLEDFSECCSRDHDVVSPAADNGLPGDFSGDGVVDCDDLDGYTGNIGASVTAELAPLDLDNDGIITTDDANTHITTLVQTSNGQVGTCPGDLNCDGTVDVLGDAFVLVGNLGNAVTSYSQGDINFDGIVDVLGDAFVLVSNLGKSNDP